MTKLWRTDVRLILLTLMFALLAGTAAADPPAEPTRVTKPAPESVAAEKSEVERTAQRASAAKTIGAKKRAELSSVPVTPEREERALNFARMHHRELADLLSGLKGADQKHYENAVREVARDADRIGRNEQRDPERHEVLVRIWKFDSRIRLEAARFSMDPSEETEKKLRHLMISRQKARLACLKLDRDRAKTRHQRLDEQIDMLAANPEERINAEIDRLRKTLAAKGRARTQSASPRSKNPAPSKPTVKKPTVKNASDIRAQPPRKESPIGGTRSKDAP